MLSFLRKSSSVQTPETAHKQHMPMSSIKTRHTKQKLSSSMRSEAEIIDEGTCFPFERI